MPLRSSPWCDRCWCAQRSRRSTRWSVAANDAITAWGQDSPDPRVAGALCRIALIPWTVYLGLTLPQSYTAKHWQRPGSASMSCCSTFTLATAVLGFIQHHLLTLFPFSNRGSARMRRLVRRADRQARTTPLCPPRIPPRWGKAAACGGADRRPRCGSRACRDPSVEPRVVALPGAPVGWRPAVAADRSGDQPGARARSQPIGEGPAAGGTAVGPRLTFATKAELPVTSA